MVYTDARVAYYERLLRSGDGRRRVRRATDSEQHMVHAQWFTNFRRRGQQHVRRSQVVKFKKNVKPSRGYDTDRERTKGIYPSKVRRVL